MGTCNSNSKSGGGGGYRINNPANIPSNHMTEDEFLALRGVGGISSGYTVDKLRGNRQLKSERGKRRFKKEVLKAEDDYQAKKQKAKLEYQALVSQGKIIPKSAIERIITSAHGHPDLQATQAARRMAKKKGIDWKTGKKIK